MGRKLCSLALLRRHCCAATTETGDDDNGDNNSDNDILDAIQEGPGAMPSYADKLSEAEQLALVRAVRDLRKP